MAENTIICCKCGAELPASQTICTKCGCEAIKRFNVTVRKAKGSYMESALTTLTFIGEKDSVRVSVSENYVETFALQPGVYTVEIICRILTLNTKLIISEDSTFDVGVKLGFFKNQLFINKV